MPANTSPIFSASGKITSCILTTASADYNGQASANATLFSADTTNGSYIQRLRCKALGTNVASVLRVYVNNGFTPRASIMSAPTSPTGTASSSGGTLSSGNYFAKIHAVDAYGGVSSASAETSSVAVTGPTGSITWSWTAVTNAASYIVSVGIKTAEQVSSFTSVTNTYIQTDIGSPVTEANALSPINNYFIGEVSLPATTASATAATADIDYPLNVALGPGQSIVVGLGTTVAAGWVVTAIGGNY